MIVHFRTSPSLYKKAMYRGADIGYWYTKLYPELNWDTSKTILPETIVFIWNTEALTFLNQFDAWHDRFVLPILAGHKWVTCPDRLFWVTRYDNLIPLLQEDLLNPTVLQALKDPCIIQSTPQPLFLTDSVEIHRTISAYQYRYYLDQGVSILDPMNFYIESLPSIGVGSRLHSSVIIEGDTVIGENVSIGPNVHLVNAHIGRDATILTGSLIYDSVIEASTHIGPYAHLRAGTTIMESAKIGNFVEVKKSTIGNHSKAMHLSYLGDATLGNGVNIGAGTITCNYDGKNKHPTHIEDNVFVGSGTELVAPLTLEKHSFVAAGSTITESVPPYSLAVARMKQRIIPGWTKKRSKKS